MRCSATHTGRLWTTPVRPSATRQADGYVPLARELRRYSPRVPGGSGWPRPPLTWVALAGSAVLTVAGLLAGLPEVFSGHLAGWLPGLSLLTFVVVFPVTPAVLAVCIAAAYQGDGRRALRCLAIVATLLGGLLLVWWLVHTAPPARPVFRKDGQVTLSHLAARRHGLLSWAASLGMFCVSAWILLRPSHQSRPSPS